MVALVGAADATHMAVKSGVWSAPTTWKDGLYAGSGGMKLTRAKKANADYRRCMASPAELIDQVSAFHADAFGWAVACCGGDAESAADALQESYLKVATGRAVFGGRSSLKTWWLGVVRFTVLEQHRGRHRWLRNVEAMRDWLMVFGREPAEPMIEESWPALDADQLLAALGHLPARQEEIMRLRFQHDLSVAEAAEVMGVSVGSARQHYERAKKKLRVLLTSREPICDHVT
jgi:RNA polymerase sigma-70 factor (ECF subfamily)